MQEKNIILIEKFKHRKNIGELNHDALIVNTENSKLNTDNTKLNTVSLTECLVSTNIRILHKIATVCASTHMTLPDMTYDISKL